MMPKWIESRKLLLLSALPLLVGCTSAVPCDLRDKTWAWACAFRAHSETPKRDERSTLIGELQTDPPPKAPVVVVLYEVRQERVRVVETQILRPPGPYTFIFTTPAGVYHLAAFEDSASDWQYDPRSDRAALYHDGGPIVLMPKQTVDRLYIRLRNDIPQQIGFAVSLVEPLGQ